MKSKKVRYSKIDDSFFRPDYREINEDVKRVVKQESEPITKIRNIVFDGNQFLVRFPTEIANAIDIKKGDKIEFVVKLFPDDPNRKELKMEYKRG